MTKRIFIIAGELSGDRLGAALMNNLSKLDDFEFMGIGGPQMSAAGIKSRFDMSELSVMGLLEVVPKIPNLLKRVRETADAIIAEKPDAVVTIDSPDFCLRVLDKAKAALPNLKTIHYVAPSVWAWRPERAEKMAKYVDHVLALLPFEPPYMEAAGMSCDFVGHPVTSEPEVTKADQIALRRDLGFSAKDRVITLLPGSRKSEISRMLPIYLDTVRALAAANRDIKFAIAVAPSVKAEVQKRTAKARLPIALLLPTGSVEETEARKRALYALSDCAIATSGTVALELAAQDCPMVIAYKANWMTTRLVKKLAKIDTANLINILTETRVVPEYLFEAATVENIVRATQNLLSSDKRQTDALRKAMHLLGKGDKDAEHWAARSVLRYLGYKCRF